MQRGSVDNDSKKQKNNKIGKQQRELGGPSEVGTLRKKKEIEFE